MQNILILGAGLMQKPAILEAKKIAHTVVVDANKNAVCVPLADEFFQIDLKNKEEIFSLAQKLNSHGNVLKGIFTAGTDFSTSVSYSAQKLNLPCHSFLSTLNATDKSLMRECFKKNNVPSPYFAHFCQKDYKIEEINDFAQKIGFPLVVKPCDNMGARGCRIVRAQNELFSAVNDGFNFSRNKTIIIEEYMDGPEFSIDALVYNGTLTVTGFADRHIFYPPYFIEMGHTLPSNIEENKKNELISVFAQGVKVLGLSCGAAKADIKYTKNGPMIGEIAARLSGGYMSGWTFPYSSDFSLTKQALLIACGLEPEELLQNRKPLLSEFPKNSKNKEVPFSLFEIPSKKVSAERAWISIPGVVQNILGLENAKISGVKDVLPREIKIGEQIDFPRNNVSKCGNVIAVSSDYKKAAQIAEKSVSKIFIRLKPNNQKTNNFLSSVENSAEKSFPPDAYSFYSQIKDLKIPGTILENTPAKNFIPEMLKKYFSSSEKSWDYLTLQESLDFFDENFKIHPELSCEIFFKALFRGGRQAIVYVSDSVSENLKNGTKNENQK